MDHAGVHLEGRDTMGTIKKIMQGQVETSLDEAVAP